MHPVGSHQWQWAEAKSMAVPQMATVVSKNIQQLPPEGT